MRLFRFIPRFSLRSLLLLSLLVSSGFLLYMDFAPWQRGLILIAGRDKKTEKGDGYQTLASFSPDGKSICYCGDTTFPRVCNATTGADLFQLNEHPDSIISVNYSPNGRWILSSGSDGIARLWNARTGTQEKSFDGHNGRFICAAFSSDSTKFITAGADKIARIWDISSGKEIAQLAEQLSDVREPEFLSCVAFSPDGRTVATVHGYNILNWNTEDWKLAKATATGTTYFCATFTSDSYALLTGASDSDAYIWAVKGDVARAAFVGHDAQKHVHAATFLDGGSKILTASCDNTVRVWDVATQKQLAIMSGQSDLISASVSADSRSIASSNRDGTTWIWHRRRPEWWWGVAWLPGFWLLLLFTSAFAWSVRRDRGELRKTAVSASAV
jgi:WD40 repeat protein